jgi:hypothetical protein
MSMVPLSARVMVAAIAKEAMLKRWLVANDILVLRLAGLVDPMSEL